MIEEASEAEKKKILKSTNRLSALSQNLHINSNLIKINDRHFFKRKLGAFCNT